MSKRLIICALILFTLFGAFASTLYVSGANGDDTNGDGTKSNPYKTLATAVSNIASSGDIVLLSDITQTGKTSISGKTITIDGSGHSVFGSAFDLSNSANLTLKNINIDGQNAIFDTDGFILISASSLTLNAGTSIGNAKTSSEGKNSNCNIFRIYNHSSVTMNEGSCIHNLETPFGAIRFESSTFTMNGGTIRDCGNTPNYKGDWENAKESVTLHFSESSCYIKGGTITSNSGVVREAQGIVYLHQNSSLEITGGTLSGNTVKNGAGLCLGNSGNTFKISGNPVIANNVDSYTEGRVSNLYLPAGQSIALSAPLTKGANIGLYTVSVPTSSSDVLVVTNATLNDVQYIHSDNQSKAGIVYCDGTNDFTAEGKVVKAHHTCSASTKGNVYLSEIAAHVHIWQYNLSSDCKSLTAICVNQDHKAACSYQDNNGTTITMEPLYKGHIDVEIEPNNASASLLWVSANPDVVSVDNDGNVLGLKPGSSVITVTSGDGTEFSDSVTVHVPN